MTALPMGDPAPPTSHTVPGPSTVHAQNGIMIGSAIFVRLTIVSNRQKNTQKDYATEMLQHEKFPHAHISDSLTIYQPLLVKKLSNVHKKSVTKLQHV